MLILVVMRWFTVSSGVRFIDIVCRSTDMKIALSHFCSLVKIHRASFKKEILLPSAKIFPVDVMLLGRTMQFLLLFLASNLDDNAT